jgi:hypothetical protein
VPLPRTMSCPEQSDEPAIVRMLACLGMRCRHRTSASTLLVISPWRFGPWENDFRMISSRTRHVSWIAFGCSATNASTSSR